MGDYLGFAVVRLKAYTGQIIVDVIAYGTSAEDAKKNCGSAMNIGPFDLPDGERAQGQTWRAVGHFRRRPSDDWESDEEEWFA